MNEEYSKVVTTLVDWLKEQIDKSENKHVAIKIEDLKKEMGTEFLKKNDEEIYNGIIMPFWHEGINIIGASKQEKTGKNVLVLRKKYIDDVPPSSPYFYPGISIENIDAIIEKNKSIIEKTEKIYHILNIYFKKHLHIWPIYAQALIDTINTMKADEIWYFQQDNSLTFWWD